MSEEKIILARIFDGWDGTNTSIVHAIQPLTTEQMAWRPAPNLRSVSELASHIALGRVDWFARMPAPGSLELRQKIDQLGGEAAVAQEKDQILQWLDLTWEMISATLQHWTVADLSRSYPHTYWEHTYDVSFQWTIWRIMTHDIHHGGELALMLGMQGLEVPELGDLFGHLTEPPIIQ